MFVCGLKIGHFRHSNIAIRRQCFDCKPLIAIFEWRKYLIFLALRARVRAYLHKYICVNISKIGYAYMI